MSAFGKDLFELFFRNKGLVIDIAGISVPAQVFFFVFDTNMPISKAFCVKVSLVIFRSQ
jgi:hypothetical protein